jgi:O-antigen/teichoic acid export membrane protein
MAKSPIKTLLSHTAIYGVGLVLNKSLGFLLLPVYTNYFSPSDWGVFNIVWSLWIFLSVLYSLGFENSFMKYFIEEKNKQKKAVIYSSVLAALLISSAVFSFIIYFCSDFLNSLLHFEDSHKGIFLIKILAVLLFFDTIYRIPLLLLRAELNTKVYTYLTIITLVINLGLNLFLIIGQGYGVEAIFYSYIVSVFVTTVLCLFITSSYLTLKVSFEEIKRQLSFGVKFIFIGIFILIIDISDRFFLKYYFNESTVGIYSANYRLGTVMSLIISAYKFSWTPYFMNLSENPDNKKIISNIFTYFVLTGLFLFLLFSFFIAPIVKTQIFGFYILNQAYWSGLSIIPIILLSYFFSGLHTNLTVAPFFSEKTGVLLHVSIAGLIINTILNITLIPKYEMTGAALSTLFTYIIMFIYLYYRSQQLFRLDFEIKKLVTITILTAISYFAVFFLQNIFNFSGAVLLLISIIILAIYIIFMIKFDILRVTTLKKIIMKEDT